jgi:PadR family transcriptional regulator PadR
LRHHGYRIGAGTLYPILHELEEAGYLRAAEEVVVGGKRRKNLRATARGRKLLAEAREKLVELASEIIDDKNALARRKNAALMPDTE